jgi:hypothetical protein
MPSLQHLSQEEVRDTLRRAEEIAATRLTVATSAEETVPVEEFVRAAEEVGISREAVLAALQEREANASLPGRTFRLEEKVWAVSADGFTYPAKVIDVQGERVRVHFLNGGEHEVAASTLQPLALMPGLEVQCVDKDWGWAKGKIQKYDANKGHLEIHTTFETKKKVPVASIRLAPPRSSRELAVRQVVLRASLLSGTAGIILGYLLSLLFR